MSSLKYSLALLSVVASIVVQQCLADADQPWRIEVHNDMQSKETIFVHCNSVGDDMPEHHYLKAGQQFAWNFTENMWQTSEYWCYIRNQNQNKHITIDVFKSEPWTNWLPYRCNEEVCIWSVRDEGIYVKNIPEKKSEFQAKWKRGQR